MTETRILLADDHTLFREGLASILNAQPDFIVIGEAADGLEVMVMARKLQPNLILMDIGMPGCDGVEATRRILQEQPDVIIVMLTVRNEDEKLFDAIKNGAQGYLLKSIRAANCWPCCAVRCKVTPPSHLCWVAVCWKNSAV